MYGGRQTIAQFNATLHPKERARELLEVAVSDSSKETGTHNWQKTNWFTVKGRTGYYDTFRCSACGITAKRHGLGGEPRRDPQYKAKVYGDCQKAKAHLAERRALTAT